MELKDALDAADWDAIAEALPDLGGLALLDALSATSSGDVESASPVGLWHAAAVRFNTIAADGAPPLSADALADGGALREGLKTIAEAGEVSLYRASRHLSDPGYLLVRDDGAYRAVAMPEESVALEGDAGAERTLALDLLDRVERAERDRADGWLAPADAAGPSLSERWPDGADAVLSFATTSPTPGSAAALSEALERPIVATAGILRHTGRLLMRGLYAGDFAGVDAVTRVDVALLMHRRLWAPA